MQKRYVVVPAVPTVKETFPRAVGFPSALGEGYDLYDTLNKVRLCLGLSTRAEADYECASRNGEESASGSTCMGMG
ncbi:hypothetical protein PPUJ13061_30620 [Pseudomonas putida]|uniref:Uncharacterized protein n=2 Tax=root TaxID=1 RepID=X1JMV8_9ZZZZ|nr:hypothetical protein PPUJ13061_30620 [Pseudomonas putida]